MWPGREFLCRRRKLLGKEKAEVEVKVKVEIEVGIGWVVRL